MNTKIHVSRLALAQLVAEARPDWDRDEFDGIVTAALSGLEGDAARAVFASLALRTGRLIGIDDSSAADVRQEGRSPVERAVSRPVPPSAEFAAARAALAAAAAARKPGEDL